MYTLTQVSKIYLVNNKLLQCLKNRIRFFSSGLNELEYKNDDILSKIVYNEVLARTPTKPVETKSRPIFLKYVLEDNEVSKNLKANEDYAESDSIKKNEEKAESETINFPYEIKKKFLEENYEIKTLKEVFPKSLCNFTPSDDEKNTAKTWGSEVFKIDLRNLEAPNKWLNKYEEDDSIDEVFKFGSSDPNIRVSKVPCGGCGALLHCNDPSIPGFIPVEAFQGRTNDELRSELCQRCHYLREYNISLGVNVSPSEYIKILNTITYKEAVALVMIDLLDFPCSVFPEIFNIIGPNKPVVILGNKVDLLIKDGEDYLKNFQYSVLHCLKKLGLNLKNLVHFELISAKTGYGIEKLIDQLHLNWGSKGDVYLIGCTNVGKSTLFNTLIQSDYCKTQAVNILHRATVSNWPGTTLNLLKFPIMKLRNAKLAARLNRLKYQRKEEAALKKYQIKNQNIKLEQIPLQEYVDRSIPAESEESNSMEIENFSNDERKGLNPLDFEFRSGKWFYDTPGVVNEDQIVNLLTTSELLLTVPQKMLLPRVFHLEPGDSIFIAGLARLDYVQGASKVWFTVYASLELPITVTTLKNADYVYKKLLGSPLFRVPVSGKERLAKWPELSSKKLEVIGKLHEFGNSSGVFTTDEKRKPADADIVLSSAGWVALTVPTSERCRLEAWTPQGKGIYIRDAPLIKYGNYLRGRRIGQTPAFHMVVKESKGITIKDEPPF